MSINIKKIKNTLINKYVWLLLVIVFTVVLLVLGVANKIDIMGKTPTKSIGEAANTEMTNVVDYGPPKAEDSLTSPEKNNTPKLDEPSTDPSAEISVLITRASRSSVGVFIEKISAGTCRLTITQSGVEKISMTADVLQERDYSTCKGFDFDSSKLDSTPIVIKVTVTSENRTGTTTQEVE